MFYNSPTNPTRLVFFRIISKLKNFIQGLETLIVSHWLNFTQQIKNSCKLNKIILSSIA
jgi:hypothetical protein